MKNLESQKFEESWRNAFSDAEANPPDNVWTNIELQLSRAESGDMKRRVVFYQRLAAAAVIFAIALSGGIWYSTNEQELLTDSIRPGKRIDPESRSATENSGARPAATNLTKATKPSSNDKMTGHTGKPGSLAAFSKNKNEDNANQELTLDLAGKQPTQQKVPDEKYDSIPAVILLAEEGLEKPLQKNNETSLNKSDPASKVKDEPAKEIPIESLFAEPVITQVDSKKKTNTNEDWWASLGGTAGSYNPNPGTGAAPVYMNTGGSGSALNTGTQQKNNSRVGTSFSFGMNFGKKIAPRLMLMSGFNFLTQSTEYSSNVAMRSANNSAFAADALSQSSSTTPTTSYTVSNVSEFVSIPFQAGYLFIDRKVGLQLNAGIASDFFVKNTLTDQSGNLLRYSQGPGDNSLYRPVNLTGLMATELSYKIAQHYRVSLVPGLRYSFNSVLKSTAGATINPMVWDVGFRFRYMF